MVPLTFRGSFQSANRTHVSDLACPPPEPDGGLLVREEEGVEGVLQRGSVGEAGGTRGVVVVVEVLDEAAGALAPGRAVVLVVCICLE